MQETIVHLLETEKKAAEIISKAEENYLLQINKANSEMSEELNKFKSKEQKRFQQEVKKMEEKNLDRVNSSGIGINENNINFDDVSEKVLERVLRTVFD